MVMAKTADEARKAAMSKKPVARTNNLRKGGGKGLSGDALVGKVSQKTIDSIKKLGMTKALSLAVKNGKTSGGMAREFQEGVRRMYGAKRLEAAKTKYAPVKAKTADAARAGVTKPAPKPVTKPTTKPTTKPGTKSNSNFGKAVAGLYGAAAVGAMVASKGKAAGLAAKLSPAVGAAAKSRVGKAVFGTGETLTNKAFSASGRMAAKAGKPVSQTQYDAMMAAAKAKGIKAPTADAAKKAATKTTKTTKTTKK
jgi:hypothetical protein